MRCLNWFVVTGAPAAGKSSTLARLKEIYDCTVVSEAARDLIDTELADGRTLAEIRRDESVFQSVVFSQKVAREAALSANEIVLFDRGIHDTIAFLELRNLQPTAEMVSTCKDAPYARVFILERLSTYYVDYARSETSQQAAHLEQLLITAYAGHNITVIPAMGIDERAHLIREWLPPSPSCVAGALPEAWTP